MKKLESVQVLRGLAALGVVLYHMLIIEKKYSGGDFILPNIFKTGQSGVDLFFVISGFIMVTINQSRWGQNSKTGKFLLHRLCRIYPNYWFYFFITFGVVLMAPSLVNESQGNRFSFLQSFLLLPTIDLPLVLVAWSLTYELFFYLVFAFLLRFNEKRMLPFLLAWFTFLITVHFLIPLPLQNAWLRLFTSPYSIEFICGALAARLAVSKYLVRIPPAIYFILIPVILLALPILFINYYAQHPEGLFLQCLIFGPFYGLLVVCMVGMEKNEAVYFPRFLITVGDISYTIYLSHVLILGAAGRLWQHFFQNRFSIRDNIVVFPLMLILIIAYSYFAFRIIEQRSYLFFLKIFEPKRKTFLKQIRF